MLAVVEVQTTQVCMKLKGEAGVDCLPDNFQTLLYGCTVP